MRLYPRKCEECGKGMDDGWLVYGDTTICSTECLSNFLYREDVCFYTEWEDEDISSGEPMYTSSGDEVYLKKEDS